MPPARSFLFALITLGLALVLCDRALAWYAPRHFIPEARLAQALEAGPGAVLVAGDSRMVAGFDERELSLGLRESGRAAPAASVAVGALRLQGMAVAIREYLERGGRPQIIVLGASEDTLLARSVPPDPATFIGNEAVLLSWSRASDVFLHYPGFPWQNVDVFDRGLRFGFARSTALGTYLSLGWQRVQAAQDRWTGRSQATNAFGALTDMEASGRRMERDAQGLLDVALRRPEAERLDPAFEAILLLAREVGASLVVVELPMPSSYRQRITDSAAGRRYLTWLSAFLAARSARLIDLTHPPWLDAEHFADFVHLNAAGARRFSRDLGRGLGAASLDGRAPRVGEP